MAFVELCCVMTLGRNKQKNILYLTLVSLCSASARYDWLHTIFLDLFIQTCGPSPYYGTWVGGALLMRYLTTLFIESVTDEWTNGRMNGWSVKLQWNDNDR